MSRADGTVARGMQLPPANPARPDRSAVAYIVALAIVCLTLLLSAPFSLVPLGAVALTVLAVVWAKAGIRTGRWLWLRPGAVLRSSERAAWSASLVVLVFGAGALAYGGMLMRSTGVPLTFTIGPFAPSVGTSAVSYSNPETLQAAKDALKAAGVPHTVELRDGKEWLTWEPKHNEAAEKVMQAVRGGPLPNGRNISFGDSAREAQFTAWLTQRGVPYRRVDSHGKSFIVWEGDETSDRLMDAFDRDQLQQLQAQPKDCPKTATSAAQRSAKKGC